jgi:hypothetical protein
VNRSFISKSVQADKEVFIAEFLVDVQVAHLIVIRDLPGLTVCRLLKKNSVKFAVLII